MEDPELNPCVVESRFSIIFDAIKNTADEINSVNVELKLIRETTIALENRNDCLVKKFQDLVTNLSKVQFKNTFTQSEIIDVCDIGVNCENKPELVDFAMQTEEQILEVTSPVEEAQMENTINVESIEESPIVIDTTVVIKEHLEDQYIYSKTDMLFYLERYKINFLSFVQCNKNDIESISGGCNELIRSFSNNSAADKKKPKKLSERQTHKSDNKLGVVDTKDAHIDEGISSSLYDDLDFHDIPDNKVLQEIVSESEIETIGGAKRLVAMSNMTRNNRLNIKPKKFAETWRTEISDLAEKHETFYPKSTEPVKEKSEPEVKMSTETVFSKRMKEQFETKYDEKPQKAPVVMLSTVKYDLSISDSPLFHTSDHSDYRQIKEKVADGNSVEEEVSCTENVKEVTCMKEIEGVTNVKKSQHESSQVKRKLEISTVERIEEETVPPKRSKEMINVGRTKEKPTAVTRTMEDLVQVKKFENEGMISSKDERSHVQRPKEERKKAKELECAKRPMELLEPVKRPMELLEPTRRTKEELEPSRRLKGDHGSPKRPKGELRHVKGQKEELVHVKRIKDVREPNAEDMLPVFIDEKPSRKHNSDPKQKRRHSSKKKSQKTESKELEEGEIV